jgi:hypothetical protein
MRCQQASALGDPVSCPIASGKSLVKQVVGVPFFDFGGLFGLILFSFRELHQPATERPQKWKRE